MAKSLVALLLVLFYGSVTANDVLDAIEPGYARQIADYLCTGPDFYPRCKHLSDFGGMVYDTQRHRVLQFGGGHATTFNDAVIAFDPVTLKWTELYPPTPCSAMTTGNHDIERQAWKAGPSGPYPRPLSRHSYDMLAIVGDELILNNWVHEQIISYCNVPITKGAGKIAHFDLLTNTWSFSDVEPFGKFAGSDVDPLSREILVINSYGIWIYDPAERKKRVLSEKVRPLGYDSSLVYFPPHDAFYYFGLVAGTVKTYKATPQRDPNNRINAIAIDPVEASGDVPSNQRGYAYDPLNELIGGGVSNNTFYAFDPATRIWHGRKMQGDVPGKDGSAAFHSLVYDLIDGVYIFWSSRPSFTYAYRWKADPAPAPRPPGNVVISVKPGGVVPTPSAAAAIAKDGDRIEIAAGVYQDAAIWSANDITIVGVGGTVLIKGSGLIGNKKGLWVIKGTGVTVEGVDFTGARVADENGAGIRVEGIDITIRKCRFYGNENGVLINNIGGAVVVENSIFEANGFGDGLTHNIYVGLVDRLIFKNNRSIDAIEGHTLKSRARYSEISGNSFEEGRGSYAIDLPNGGQAVITDNMIIQGARSPNHIVVSYGVEGIQHQKNSVTIEGNRFVNAKDKGVFIYSNEGKFKIKDNVFVGAALVTSGAAKFHSIQNTEVNTLVE